METNEEQKGQIFIYKKSDGPEIKLKLHNNTLWLSLNQIAALFGRDKSVISRHISAIYKEGELSAKGTVAKTATVQIEGGRKVKRSVEYFNLDAIISVGYRVNSHQGTQFRIWATSKLRNFLLKGYIVNEQLLRQQQETKLRELENTVKLFQNVLETNRAHGYEQDLLKIITDYTGTWVLLNKYDQGSLEIENVSRKRSIPFAYEKIKDSIERLKTRLVKNKQASDIFGREVDLKLKALLGNIAQSLHGKLVYDSIDERAAHILYFVIKDHPFADGNKRIGALLFLLYLVENNYLYKKNGERKLNDNALSALAVLIAESKPEQKDSMIKLIVNLINKR